MASNNSFAGNLGKGALGVGAGFALYFLLRNLRFGGGFGLGDGYGVGEGRGEGVPAQPPSGPPPSLPKDEVPLLYWVFNPASFKREDGKASDPTSRARNDARFLPIDLGTAAYTQAELRARVRERLLRDPNYKAGPSMTIDDVIARVKAGGRDDVRLMYSGAITSGALDDAKDALMAAGLKHWELWEEAPADRKPGEPPKLARWDLYDKGTAADLNPDKHGHYHFENSGTAYWNLRRDPAPHVSGSVLPEAPRVAANARGQYGAGTLAAWRRP